MGFSRALFPCSHGRGKERGDLRGSELAGRPAEEVEEEDAALSIRGPDPGDHARAVGKESQDLSVKGGGSGFLRRKRSSRPSRIRTRRSARARA
jgi:hypothetical protein